MGSLERFLRTVRCPAWGEEGSERDGDIPASLSVGEERIAVYAESCIGDGVESSSPLPSSATATASAAISSKLSFDDRSG